MAGYGFASNPPYVLALVAGTEFHEADAGASSMVWHADKPNATGSTRIRSWDVRYTKRKRSSRARHHTPVIIRRLILHILAG
jgi:hypothetical protein